MPTLMKFELDKLLEIIEIANKYHNDRRDSILSKYRGTVIKKWIGANKLLCSDYEITCYLRNDDDLSEDCLKLHWSNDAIRELQRLKNMASYCKEMYLDEDDFSYIYPVLKQE